MHERELRAFVKVAEMGRMDHAAKELGYSQPALSYQVKCLEQDLRAKLFERDSLGTRLTADGQAILPVARAALALMDRIRVAAAVQSRPQPDPALLPGRAV